MKLKIDRHDLAKVIAAVPADKPTAEILLVKDDGIYVMSGAEPRPIPCPPTWRHTVAYAKGFAPVGDAWHEKCSDAVGGDDFGETIGTRQEFEQILADSEGDIIINVTANALSTSYLPKISEAEKTERIKHIQDWLAKTTVVAEEKWSPKFKATVKKAKKELAALGVK